ncbi:HTTM domain-containing protein [Spongiivirga citrea]|uniref:HTTM domain-containing protein n=1 Tax=Spongiivirga citrea TaxID=1481457 RepID=A0A6M0CK57_9FLAO|nr:HTTM domain-containing protein [Spongiivirga citrea]NER18002.1 HTTM domain-containing protein [Spongiivirga citrea]
MLNKWLFKQVDNSALIVFRIMFGLLIFLESVGAIFTGWIRRTLVEPDFTFTFIGFEWLQPLPGDGMYFYYAIMGVFGLMVMLGYKYRLAIISFTIMWTATYLMQKTSYNNHYYLLILICAIMAVLPANRYHSIDAKQNPEIKSISMPNWCRWIVIIQLWIVYTFASVAKFYPDWLDHTVAQRLMLSRANYPIVGELLQHEWAHICITYMGIGFDMLIIPLLLIKHTRKWAFFASIFFHLFNSIVFQIGIFPYLSLAFALFFFEPKTVRNIFLKKKELYLGNEIIIKNYKNILVSLGLIYFIIQIALPLRHHFIKDDVLWTEEGHRMSWRMMLRSKSGYINFRVVEEETKKVHNVNLSDYVSTKQMRTVTTKPDVIWQFAQRLKKEYAEKGIKIAVYADGKVSVNNRQSKRLVDNKVNLANAKWNYFGHQEWLLPSDLYPGK